MEIRKRRGKQWERMKRFNTSGTCFADIHYMVNLDRRVDRIVQELVLENKYFVINRARQYGKTTTLDLIYRKLRNDFSVFLLSFEDISSEAFSDELKFCKTFLRLLKTQMSYNMTEGISDAVFRETDLYIKQGDFTLSMLKDFITHMCMDADRPVLLIIDEVDQASNNQVFLDFLAILRSMYLKRRYIKTFQSVILAGVYDVKNLQLKIRPNVEHRYNSPWNIAADFNIDMSFSAEDIAGMLKEYEEDHGNRIFETRLYNRYLTEDTKKSAIADAASMGKNQFVANGALNMDLVMEKFMMHFTEIYGNSEVKFLEENGRRIFLTYLKPIINGTGNYYIEARTRDMKRTDVIVDYLGRQYVIEMKIWHGNEYNHRGELQLAGYLDDYGLDQGYLVSFNFNKNKKTELKEIQCKGKRILEVVV